MSSKVESEETDDTEPEMEFQEQLEQQVQAVEANVDHAEGILNISFLMDVDREGDENRNVNVSQQEVEIEVKFPFVLMFFNKSIQFSISNV